MWTTAQVNLAQMAQPVRMMVMDTIATAGQRVLKAHTARATSMTARPGTVGRRWESGHARTALTRTYASAVRILVATTAPFISHRRPPMKLQVQIRANGFHVKTVVFA